MEKTTNITHRYFEIKLENGVTASGNRTISLFPSDWRKGKIAKPVLGSSQKS